MGYYVKMQELLETGHRLVRQTEEWKKQLEAVRSCVQDFIRDPGCSGRAAESMKAYMKEVHLTLLDWMLANIASYRSSLIMYVNGYREIEPDPGAKISQDVLEEELEFLIREKAAYEQTAEELRQVYRELRGVMDIGADTCDGLSDQYDAAIRYVEKVRCDVGEYEEQHSHDLESFHEMNGYIKGMIERHMGGDARGLTSYRAGSLAGLPEYERADALYSGNRTYVESAVEQVKAGLFHMESCAWGRTQETAGAGILGGNLPGSGVVAAKGVALGGKAEKEAGLNAGIFRQMDGLRAQAGGKIGYAITSEITKSKITVDKIREQEAEAPPLVTADMLRACGWHSEALTDENIQDLNRVLEKYEINTSQRILFFISECAYETGYGQRIEENVTAQDLIGKNYEFMYRGVGYIQFTHKYAYQAFATYLTLEKYPELGSYASYKNPADSNAQMIDAEYEKLLEGAEELGIDIREFTNIVDIGCEYVSDNFVWESAGYYWKNSRLNELVDNGGDIEAVSAVINGKDASHLSDRIKVYQNIVESGVFQ